jgi:uncharacterized protein (TIGR02996 family)
MTVVRTGPALRFGEGESKGVETAFNQAIRNSPDDDVTRLIYADWLEERGDPRADFLRVECRVHEMSETSLQYRTLKRQLGRLAKHLDIRWLATVCRVHFEIEAPHRHPSRCSLTVAGPFYTCGSCLACEAPEAEAPDLLAPLGIGNFTTYFVRQPETVAEIERACRAAEVCCVLDLRYGGTDPKIITRLGNDPAYCDNLLVEDSPRLVPAPPRWREDLR